MQIETYTQVNHGLLHDSELRELSRLKKLVLRVLEGMAADLQSCTLDQASSFWSKNWKIV